MGLGVCTESFQGNCQVIISTRGEGDGAIGGDVCCAVWWWLWWWYNLGWKGALLVLVMAVNMIFGIEVNRRAEQICKMQSLIC